MIKYYCDICNEEIQNDIPKVGALDFGNGILQLCNTCYPKFSEAKSTEYPNFSLRYNALNQEYKQAIIDDITTDVDPAPVGEDTEFTFENNP